MQGFRFYQPSIQTSEAWRPQTPAAAWAPAKYVHLRHYCLRRCHERTLIASSAHAREPLRGVVRPVGRLRAPGAGGAFLAVLRTRRSDRTTCGSEKAEFEAPAGPLRTARCAVGRGHCLGAICLRLHSGCDRRSHHHCPHRYYHYHRHHHYHCHTQRVLNSESGCHTVWHHISKKMYL